MVFELTYFGPSVVNNIDQPFMKNQRHDLRKCQCRQCSQQGNREKKPHFIFLLVAIVRSREVDKKQHLSAGQEVDGLEWSDDGKTWFQEITWFAELSWT